MLFLISPITKILFVFPDCALKTRHWDETKKALIEMVAAAQEMRAAVEAL
ncbi:MULTISPECIES: hypothetical protein [unclassified Flavobacterium]|nr:hypothetical protein [Flavobacterium sp. SLB02]MBF4484686.1 hypothetical protein [Flavobacterium sp. CSZ]QGK75762.1 hypothetical protein GIY83_17295 [Flavobacterium sp. SLB02]